MVVLGISIVLLGLIPLVLIYQLGRALPSDIDAITRKQITETYSRPMAWGPYLDKIDKVQITTVRHAASQDESRTNLWCFTVKITGQRKHTQIIETAKWFAEQKTLGEWQANAVDLLSNPDPYLTKCGWSR